MRKNKSKLKRYNIPVFIILMLVSICMIFPFVWMFLSAFKTPADVYTYPPKWLPSSFKFDNFAKVFQLIPFGRFYFNTIVTSVTQTFLQIALSITAAYVFAKLEFPGKKKMYMFVQSAMFIPAIVTVIPLYLMASKVKLVDTYPGIILPQILGVFTTILLISFFQSIPGDLLSAAKIDGCGYYRILWNVVIPNSTTAINAAILFAFLSHWKSYMWPLIITNSTHKRTLPVGLKYLVTESSSEYQVMMAAAFMSIIPILIVYIICEKSFTRSLTMTGLKG